MFGIILLKIKMFQKILTGEIFSLSFFSFSNFLSITSDTYIQGGQVHWFIPLGRVADPDPGISVGSGTVVRHRSNPKENLKHVAIKGRIRIRSEQPDFSCNILDQVLIVFYTERKKDDFD